MPITSGQELVRLLPLTIPLIGAVLTALAGAFVPARLRGLLVAGFAAGSLVCTLALWTDPTWSVTSQALSPLAESGLLEATLRLESGPWTLFAALLITTTALLASLATLGFPTSRGSAALSLLAITACLGASASANLLTLVTCWIALDLVLLGFNAWNATSLADMGRARWRAVVSYLTALAPLFIIITQMRSAETGTDGWCSYALVVAALVRIGAYPFPYPLSSGKNPPIASAVIAQVASIAAGGTLLARLSPGSSPVRATMVPVLTIALLITALLAWLTRDSDRVVRRVAANQAVGIALAFYLAPYGDTGVAALMLVNLALCLACIAGDSRHLPAGDGLRDLAGPLIAFASLSGIPGTAGFAARWRLASTALTEWGLYVPLGMALSGALIVAPLLRRARTLWSQPRDERKIQSWASGTALRAFLVLALLIAAAGLFPRAAGSIATGSLSPAVTTHPLAKGEPALATLLLVTLVVPLAGGYLGNRLWLRIPTRFVPAAAVTEETLDLDWLHRGLEWLARKARAVLRVGARLVEGGLGTGWTLAWVLVLLFWLLGEV